MDVDEQILRIFSEELQTGKGNTVEGQDRNRLTALDRDRFLRHRCDRQPDRSNRVVGGGTRCVNPHTDHQSKENLAGCNNDLIDAKQAGKEVPDSTPQVVLCPFPAARQAVDQVDNPPGGPLLLHMKSPPD